MTAIFEVILIPNISITQEDTDWYEDEPETYVKNDLEETDVETRRSICKKFLQRLTKQYQNEMGDLLGTLINQLLEEY